MAITVSVRDAKTIHAPATVLATPTYAATCKGKPMFPA